MKKIISLVLVVSMMLSLISMPTKAIALGAKESISQSMAYEYLEVINSIIEEYGIIRDNYVYYGDTSGLFYADLLDFNGDNVRELFCMYLCDEGYRYEIWKFEDNKAKNIFSKFDRSIVSREAKSVSLVTIDGKSHVLEIDDSFEYAGINGLVQHTIFGMENDNWVEKGRLEYSYLHLEGEDNPYLQEFAGQETGDFYYLIKNGESSSITEEEYNSKVNKYENNSKALLVTGSGGAGTIEILVDISEGNKNLQLFMESLSSKLISSNLKDVYADKSLEEKSKIIEFLNIFDPISSFDISSIDHDQFTYLLQRYVEGNIDYDNVKYEEINDWTYFEIEEEELLNISRQLFGIELLPKTEEYGFLKQNGKWYIGDPAYGFFSYISAQPVSMYDLGNGMYYVQIDFCAIYDEYEDIYFDKAYLDVPIEEWNLDLGLKENVEYKGYAIIKDAMVDGQRGYNLLKLDSTRLLTEEQIQKYIKRINPEPNITFDYSKIKEFKEGSEYISFLEDTLKGLSGQKPNDSGNNQIITYIQYAIENSNIIPVKSKENMITIDNSIITYALSKAENLKSDLEKILRKYNINLIKEIETILKVNVENLNSEQAILVAFDPSSVESIDKADGIRVILGDTRHSIYVESENLIGLVEDIGKLLVQIQRGTEEGDYYIVFLDGNGREIHELPYQMNFSLPASSHLATVFVNYKNGSDNWGGQYKDAERSIEFSTRYSGQYSILENEINIDDIGHLKEEQQEAIKFMVSKGYFELMEGKFNGHAPLNRYEFTKALVKMFFALDREAEASFTDITKENLYYPYIASAQKDNIVEGFDDNTFRGEINIPKEQVLVLCGRTLAEKKGYVYPENLEDYLDFADRDAISDWALKDISITVQNGLIENGGLLMPQMEISRVEAAEILYKLFMMLYETPPIAVEIEETEVAEATETNTTVGDKSNGGVLIGLTAAAVILGAVGFYFVKKKR